MPPSASARSCPPVRSCFSQDRPPPLICSTAPATRATSLRSLPNPSTRRICWQDCVADLLKHPFVVVEWLGLADFHLPEVRVYRIQQDVPLGFNDCRRHDKR